MKWHQFGTKNHIEWNVLLYQFPSNKSLKVLSLSNTSFEQKKKKSIGFLVQWHQQLFLKPHLVFYNLADYIHGLTLTPFYSSFFFVSPSDNFWLVWCGGYIRVDSGTLVFVSVLGNVGYAQNTGRNVCLCGPLFISKVLSTSPVSVSLSSLSLSSSLTSLVIPMVVVMAVMAVVVLTHFCTISSLRENSVERKKEKNAHTIVSGSKKHENQSNTFQTLEAFVAIDAGTHEAPVTPDSPEGLPSNATRKLLRLPAC